MIKNIRKLLEGFNDSTRNLLIKRLFESFSELNIFNCCVKNECVFFFMK